MHAFPVRVFLLCSALLAWGACDDSTTLVGPLPATSVVIIASSCQGQDLCGQCPIEVLVLDKNSNPTQGTIVWSTSDSNIGVVNEFGRFHGIGPGQVTVRASVAETGVFDEAVFQVPDCSGGL